MDIVTNTSTETASIDHGSTQALMQSGQIWVNGWHAIGQNAATAAQAHIAQVSAGWKAMSQAKSVKEAIEMQGALIRESIQNAVANTGKLTGETLDLVEHSMAPVKAAITLVAEKFTIRPN